MISNYLQFEVKAILWVLALAGVMSLLAACNMETTYTPQTMTIAEYGTRVKAIRAKHDKVVADLTKERDSLQVRLDQLPAIHEQLSTALVALTKAQEVPVATSKETPDAAK